MPRDPARVMTCRKCREAGEPEPFRGTFAQLGKHHQEVHPKAPKIDPDADDVSRGTSVDDGATGLGAGSTPYERPAESVPGGVSVEGGPEEEGPPRKRSWRERLWGAAGREEAGGGATALGPISGREVQPTRGKRSSTDFIFALGWKFMGARLERSERDIIVGRTMIYQSPVAGDVLEKLTKGTVIDKVLQPFARRADELEAAAALFMLPMLLGMLERNPEMMPVLEPLIRDAIRVHLVAMAPILKKERAEAQSLAEVTLELYPDAPPGTDPVDLVLGQIVAGTAFDADAQPAAPTAENAA